MIPVRALAFPLVPRPRVPAPLGRIPSVACALYLLAQPHGGQRSARQNAWAGMSGDATHRRLRVEAEDAMAAAQLRAEAEGSQGRGPGVRGPVVRPGPVALEITG